MQRSTITASEPDEHGHWGKFGGRYVPEILVAPLDELTEEFMRARADNEFWRELNQLLRDYAGRPTPLFHAQRLSTHVGGAQIYLKREDLLHTGAHKINNALGQALLARRMRKERVIAETGAGQHGVATATVCALFGLKCAIYMGAEDVRRQGLNVFRMQLLGAEVRTVNAGTRTLKDAINEAMRDWVTNVHDTHYLLGSALGPHPYPLMVREFQSVIGREAREQVLSASGNLPRDFTRVKRAAAAASAFYRARCRTCFRIRTGKLQRRIRFQPGSIIRRSGLSTRFCTITDEPNTSDRAMPKRSKDSSFAPNWRESFPRSKRRTPLCLPFVSLAS